jgi:PEP-CTERM motif
MRFTTCLGFLSVLAVTSGSAWAVPLAADPGRTTLTGTTAALQPQLAGLVLEDRVIPFSFDLPVVFGVGGGTVSGALQERVVRSTLDGTLDFHWRVFNDVSSKQPIGKVLVDHFLASTYDGDWRMDGLGEVGARYGAHAGDLVTFSFDDIFDIVRVGGIAPGSSSNFFYLDTQATHYSDTGLVSIRSFCTGDVSRFCFSGQSGALSTFAPAAVPEPSTHAMLLTGLMVGGLMLGRRRR